MKTRDFLKLLVMMLAVPFVFAACDNDDDPVPVPLLLNLHLFLTQSLIILCLKTSRGYIFSVQAMRVAA